ncbi:MAG: hypothetical protein K9W42_11400 [Candidatus Heimdallarchaeota archaeon]|nr:hypothetical protein [Candidatus Heimdallarchaeota archaeon]
MKKISPKIVALAMLILSFVGASAFGIKTAVAGRNSGGWEDEWGDGSGG